MNSIQIKFKELIIVMQRESQVSQDSSSRNSKGQVLFSTLKMALATFSSRILGLLRELVMAAMFGASGLTDAFLVAFRIPNILRDLLAEGAFSSAFVPTFTEVRHKDPQEAKNLLWSLFFILVIITSIIGFFYALFAPQLIELFAPEFKKDPVKFQISVELLRLMSPFLLCTTVAALFMGALNSLKFFFIPSVAPASANFFMILTIFGLTPFLQLWGYSGVYSMAIGVLLGGLSQVLLQVPLLLREGHGLIWPKTFFSPHAKKVIKLLGPGFIGFAATQLNVLVTTGLASATLGAVSWLNYAFRLFQFPVGILSVSIAGSNLVHFSDAWKSNQKEKAKEVLQLSYFFSWLTIVPAMILLYVLAPQTVHLLLERGKFTIHDSSMTSLVLKLYVLGLPFYGIYKIFVPVFYAIDKQRVPVITSIVCVSLNILFCLWLTPTYGFKILPVGTSLSMGLNCLILCSMSKKYLQLPMTFFFNLRLSKIFFAGAFCYFVSQFTTEKFFNFQDSYLLKFSVFSFIGLAGVAVYFLILLLCGEGKSVFIPLKKKLKIM